MTTDGLYLSGNAADTTGQAPMIKRTVVILILLGISNSRFGYSNLQRIVLAKLVRTNTGKLKFYESVAISDKQLVDLRFCIDRYLYPPELPPGFYLTKPDSFDQMISKNRYRFDSMNRVTLYFYIGSYVSGIIPSTCQFKYDVSFQNRIDEILVDDKLGKGSKFRYLLAYDHFGNVKTIKKDSLDNEIESLRIEIK